MKEFSVSLGGQQRRLRYTARDAVELKKRFPGRPLSILLGQNAMSYDPGKGSVTADFDFELQATLLLLGLRHDDPTITENSLLGENGQPGWLDEVILAGQLGATVLLAVKAAFYWGIVTGFSRDVDEEIAQKKASAEAGDPGKASSSGIAS